MKVSDGPGQLPDPKVKVGVTTMVATTGAVPVLREVKDAILPVPLAARPMPGWLLVQTKVVTPPVLFVVKVTGATAAPLHNDWLNSGFICPIGFTVMEKVFEGPVQLTDPLVKVGVTTIVATTGTGSLLLTAKEAISPVPLDARPMPGWSLVQAKVVLPPVLVVPNVIAEVNEPLHNTWPDG